MINILEKSKSISTNTGLSPHLIIAFEVDINEYGVITSSLPFVLGKLNKHSSALVPLEHMLKYGRSRNFDNSFLND